MLMKVLKRHQKLWFLYKEQNHQVQNLWPPSPLLSPSLLHQPEKLGKEKNPNFNINSTLPPWDAIAKLSVGRTLIKGGKTKACCTTEQR